MIRESLEIVGFITLVVPTLVALAWGGLWALDKLTRYFGIYKQFFLFYLEKMNNPAVKRYTEEYIREIQRKARQQGRNHVVRSLEIQAGSGWMKYCKSEVNGAISGTTEAMEKFAPEAKILKDQVEYLRSIYAQEWFQKSEYQIFYDEE